MNAPEYYTPQDIPPWIGRYDAEVGQLGVGRTGKVGIADVELRGDGAGKTVIARQFSQVPLQVQRAIYPEASLPGMARLYIMSPSGGVLQGDRYRIDVALKDAAASQITTQGATRVYGMNSNFATQMVNITLGKGCYLEYVPHQIIPYRNSRYYQRMGLDVHDDATLIYSEVLAPGREAMGEAFEYDACCLKTVCRNQDGRMRFLENSRIEPSGRETRGLGVLRGYGTLGTVYIFFGGDAAGVEESIGQEDEKNDGTISGTSRLPNGSGVIVRILGDRTEDVLDAVSGTLGVCRKVVPGSPFYRA